MTSPQISLAQCYQLLQLPPDATLHDVDAAYLKLSYEKLHQGAKQEVAAIKVAYRTLKIHLHQAQAQAPEPTPMQDAAALLQERLQAKGLQAQVSLQPPALHIGLDATQIAKPRTAIATIYTQLESLNLDELGLADVQTVYVYGLTAPKQAAWKEQFPMPRRPALTTDDLDPYSFNNRFSNALIFPGLMLLAMLMNALSLIKILLRGVTIWIHEFGHATVAWLAGRKSIPLPIGFAPVELERSPLVYLCVLALLGLLFWAGWREQRRWPMVLAVGLALLQFHMTWLLPAEQFELLLSFGGIGGEFYLSTLLIVSFYFPMPEYWRWDFWRYPAVLGAAFTFWGSVWQWGQIKAGKEDIPWGSMWGGHGDMDSLAFDHGWTHQQIINTYNSLAGLCLTVILAVYFYILLKQNRQVLFGLWQRWLAR